MKNKIFSYEEIKGIEDKIAKEITAEHIVVTIQTLCGKENASIGMALSLDKKETWVNGIFHNSRHYFFQINRNGVIENFAHSHTVKKVRKKTVMSLRDAIEYINRKVGEQA